MMISGSTNKTARRKRGSTFVDKDYNICGRGLLADSMNDRGDARLHPRPIPGFSSGESVKISEKTLVSNRQSFTFNTSIRFNF